MYLLNTVDSFRVTSPPDTYIYDILPISGGGLASISSDDCLRLHNPLALNAAPLSVVKKVNAEVTCLNGWQGGEGVVATAGRDGKVHLIDVRSGSVVGEVKSGKFAPWVC